MPAAIPNPVHINLFFSKTGGDWFIVSGNQVIGLSESLTISKLFSYYRINADEQKTQNKQKRRPVKQRSKLRLDMQRNEKR